METATIVAVLCTVACFHGAQAGFSFGPCPSGPNPMPYFHISAEGPRRDKAKIVTQILFKTL